jgi:hypothetical protein
MRDYQSFGKDINFAVFFHQASQVWPPGTSATSLFEAHFRAHLPESTTSHMLPSFEILASALRDCAQPFRLQNSSIRFPKGAPTSGEYVVFLREPVPR